ncbi:hypothetical protein P8605_04735 [Streptomyces sp. T-3]|nr:hypothetical protein [Streptomyces sp. T-3]
MRARGKIRAWRGWGVCALAAAMTTVSPGPAQAADEDPGAYVYDPKATKIEGSSSLLGAPELVEGAAYRSVIGGEKARYFAIELDGTSNGYVSAVAVPKPGTKAGFLDQLHVALLDSEGKTCDGSSTKFRTGEFARPIAATAERLIDRNDPDAKCQKPGTYLLEVARGGRQAAKAPAWGLDLRFDTEAPLRKGQTPSAPPSTWPTENPPDPAGAPKTIKGGLGFSGATRVHTGTWRSEALPGQSLFYRVPVGFGQRLHVSAEVGASMSGTAVSNGFRVAVHNPARAEADFESITYRGDAESAEVDPLAPVAYANRTATPQPVQTMRFPGWHYIQISLSPEIATTYGNKPIEVLLQVVVEGKAQQEPQYAGNAGIFQIPQSPPKRPKPSASPQPSAADDGTGGMKILAISSLSTGVVLLSVAAGRVVRRRVGGGASSV